MAHLITVCHVCGAREPELTCSACERPVCKEHMDQGGVCEMCWAEFGAWCDERRDLERSHGEEPSEEDYADEYDDSMDGDHESALASCGWGTDEDYGCYGGEEW